MLPLEGIRILAFETWGAGCYGNMMLAQLGAEVISIENPAIGGDPLRNMDGFFFDDEKLDSEGFEAANQNKRSVTINLKTPGGQEVLQRLIKTADATLDNYRGDVADELGVTYEALKEYNPKIVCAHISGYGRTGPRASWPGYDFLMQAECGWMSVTGEPGSIPAKVGVSVVDIMGGVYGALGLLAGVIKARQTGEGCDIDTNLFDIALNSLTYQGLWSLNEGVEIKCQPRSAHASQVPSQIYRTSDGWIYVACLIEKYWKSLCREIGRPDLPEDPRFVTNKDRMTHRDELTGILDREFSKKTKSEWMEMLGGKIPCAPVYTVGEAFDSKYVKENSKVVEIPYPDRGTVKFIAPPFHLKDEAIPIRLAPKLGQDNRAILREIGYSDEQIEELRNKAVIS